MTQESTTKPVARNFNKPVYTMFVIAGIFFLAARDFSQAATFCSLALAFDPFNTAVPFPKRPFYQKAWLYVHVSISLALFVLMLLRK